MAIKEIYSNRKRLIRESFGYYVANRLAGAKNMPIFAAICLSAIVVFFRGKVRHFSYPTFVFCGLKIEAIAAIVK